MPRRGKCVMSHTWISHVTHVNEAYHTYEWVMLHIYIWMSHVTYEWVMSHIWMSHVPHMNELSPKHESNSTKGRVERRFKYKYLKRRHKYAALRERVILHMSDAYQWVMPHVWMSHVIHMNESLHMYQSNKGNGRIYSTASCMPRCANESCHTCKWVMSNMRMSYFTHTSCSTHMSPTTRNIASSTASYMPRYGLSYATHMHIYKSCHIYESCHIYKSNNAKRRV